MTHEQSDEQLLQQANAHFAKGNYLAAGKVATTVFTRNPTHPDALHVLGMVAFKSNKVPLAISLLEQSLVHRPDQTNVLFHLATVLHSGGRTHEAEIRLAQVLKLDPSHVNAHITMGNICHARNDVKIALVHYVTAIQFDPDCSIAHYNIGIMAQRFGDHELALDHFGQAIASKTTPDSPAAHMARSFSLLMTEQFKEGWQEYEWRWKLPGHSPRICPVPLWQGEVIGRGKRLYLYTEQGFGDAIMCARYIPQIRERGVRVYLECKPELLALFLDSEIADQVVAREPGDGEPPPFQYDYHLPIMSLPRFFTHSLETIPQNIPYLKPSPSEVTQWRRRLGKGPGLKVGLCWSGNPEAAANRGRACQLSDLLPITKIQGARYFSLQKGSPAGQLHEINHEQVMVDLDPVLTDFAQSAACLVNLDLLISTDTAIVHLAGALNVPCWVILHTSSEWRWLQARRDSPWYPSLTLFRQDRPDHWETVVQEVCAALSERVRERLE